MIYSNNSGVLLFLKIQTDVSSTCFGVQKNENSKIFWDAVNSTVQKLTRKQLTIWKMREQGERKKTISERTGLSTSEINYELREMRSVLDSEIKNQERIHKMEFVLAD